MSYMENDGLISVHFDSILDLVNCDTQDMGPNIMSFQNYMTRKSDIRAIGFTNSDAGDVIRHALIGDEHMYENMLSKASKLYSAEVGEYSQVVKVSKRKRVQGDHGDEYDIHKAYQGKFDSAWTRYKRVAVDENHNLVTLFIDVGDNWDISASSSLWRGAVALKITDILEREGKSVKIIVGAKTVNVYQSKYGKKSTVSIVVKDYGEKLIPERLAAMCHLGFYRVFGFAAKCCYGKQKVNSNLGQNLRIDDVVPLQLLTEVNRGHTRMVYVNRSSNLYSANLALSNIMDQIVKFNALLS